ncbi:MAG: efflux RND transporter permease subunit, partial [Halobacteriovoraceae bacterium]|nr:efflux RND transporter permease subunit [Halobacteriovoraceae bacterium]
ITFKWFDIGINTMTLGGLAVAIGGLVDDAIVGVENAFRRLKENKKKANPEDPLKVIYAASKEILNSIVFATLIVVMVFVPIFALSGIEGKLFAPLGYAYIISILASLVVAITITPVLCYYLLPNAKTISSGKDSWPVKKLKRFNQKVLEKTIDRPHLIIGICGTLFIGACSLIPLMGSNFLPNFNEGTATIGIAASPGISLEASDKLGTTMEETMLAIPEVKSTIRRTGRAEMDEHAEGVHWNEIDVDFHENKGRPREIVLNEIRQKIEALGDVYVNVGQPIGHRLDHMLSGVRAQIAIKIFGTDLTKLRQIGVQVESILSEIKGIVDLQIEPLIKIPQLKISIDREDAGKYWISPGELAENLEITLNGENVASVLNKQRIYEVFMRLDKESRSDPENIEKIALKTMPNGNIIRLGDIADVYKGSGPNMINRENMQRRLIISANSDGRDLGSLIKEIRGRINKKIKLPSGYHIQYAGQFADQQRASRLMTFLGLLALLGILGILLMEFRSFKIAIQVMTTVPLALIGGLVATYLTERSFSIATLIAFIALLGISTRNGILMISHYIHLMKEEGEKFTKEMIIRGSLERLVPVLMTTGTAILALVPLLLSQGEPGKAILYPVAVVIIGGLLSSTLLDLVVTPAVFYKYGEEGVDRVLKKNEKEEIKL